MKPLAENALAGRLILVSGASRGIGYAAALECARLGAHIIAVAKTQGGLEALDDAISDTPGEASLVPMDITNGDGIDQLGGIIYKRWGRLDGLLSCAGLLGEIAPVPHIDLKKWDQTLAVNLSANYRLIRSMDALLKASTSGRAVFISSKAAETRKAYWGVYAASKAGLDALVQCYASENEQTSLRTNIIYPGPVRTQMRAKAMPGEDPGILPSPADVAPFIAPYLSEDCALNGQIIKLRDRLKTLKAETHSAV